MAVIGAPFPPLRRVAFGCKIGSSRTDPRAEIPMKPAIRFLLSCSCLAATAVHAADGLNVPRSAWPQWGARVAVSTYDQSPRLAAASLLGDYYFRALKLGDGGTAAGFRATSGLVLGAGTAPLGAAGVPARLGAGPTLVHLAMSALPPGVEAPDAGPTLPYLGLGFTSVSAAGGVSFSADIGLVARQASDAPGPGRALLGTQSLDIAVRNLRLSPVLQLGVRYAF